MRIVAGTWRGRALTAPPGQATRPTADRARQALFDILMHAEWAGRELIDGAHVVDAFAGTGALGLEALSRGAATACFIEQDPAAMKALRANIAACRAESRAQVVAGDVMSERLTAKPAAILFLDPPYGQNLVPRAIARLLSSGVVTNATLIVAEIGRDEAWRPETPLLAERIYGAARILVFHPT